MADVKHTPDIPDGVSAIAKQALSVLGKAFPGMPESLFGNTKRHVPQHGWGHPDIPNNINNCNTVP